MRNGAVNSLLYHDENIQSIKLIFDDQAVEGSHL